MAGQKDRDWSDLNITKEELENLTQAMKKDEFRKLLVEYAEEVNDPKNKKQFQDDIIQLEAERGVDCTFINPEPGFVVKTSVDGKKKAFVNVCKNSNIGRPTSKPERKENSRGLSWSIPYSQSPGREDHDNKRNRCVVYDVVFHPDTLHLAERNASFRKMVVDTALNAIEDSYKVTLDKKNIKFPKLKFKGMSHPTVIRRKAEKPVQLSEEDIEFQKQMKYPMNPPLERDAKPSVKNFGDKKECKEKYTVPHYVIKHRAGIDLQEFTYDKHAKMNSAIPKDIVVEVNLPLLHSTSQVTLDVMEKALHLQCETPAKYKLDIQLPYRVKEDEGSAKFDKDRRLLVITLPVVRATLPPVDLLREDSGVESDYGDRGNSGDDASPEGSISQEELDSLESSHPPVQEETHAEELDGVLINGDESYWTKNQFLDANKHYAFPTFTCNSDANNLCFVLNVKNVDPMSVNKIMIAANSFHLKFSSIGSGFFPIHYAFYLRLVEECAMEEDSLSVDVWDNNVTAQVRVKSAGRPLTKYLVGADEDGLEEKCLDEPLDLAKAMEGLKLKYEDVFMDVQDTEVTVVSANVDQVVIDLSGGRGEHGACAEQPKRPTPGLKVRAYSESIDEAVPLSPVTRKSILKNRINRSLSESNADDYQWPSSVEGTLSGSDSCIPEEEEDEGKDSKKTVRFSEKIYKQVFRANSSILGQRKKNQKRTRNKRKAMERRASESENSEGEERDRRTGGSAGSSPAADPAEGSDYEDDDDLEDCDVGDTVIPEEAEPAEPTADFKSDLIFALDM